MSNQRVFVELKQKKNKKKKPEAPRQVGSPALAGFLTVCGEVFLAVAENMKKNKKKNKEAHRAAERSDELTQDNRPDPVLPPSEVIGDPITEAIKEELTKKGKSKD